MGPKGEGYIISVRVARAPIDVTEENQTELVGDDAGVRLGVTTASTVAILRTNASAMFYSHSGD